MLLESLCERGNAERRFRIVRSQGIEHSDAPRALLRARAFCDLSRIFQFRCFVQFRSANAADAAFECVQRW